MVNNEARRFLFVINPIAGTRSKGGLEAFIYDFAKTEGWQYDVLHSTPLTQWANVADAADSFGATDVIACGGDGTVNMVVGAVANTNRRLGIVPVGSGNGLARAAAIPLKPSQALAAIKAGKVMATDAFKVNDQIACMLAGLGLDAAVAERFSHSTSRGLTTYTTQTLIQYFKAQPYQFEVVMDGVRFFTDAFFISVANSNQYGNNMTIAPQASISDGLLDIIIVQKMSKLGLPFAILQQIRGNNRLQQIATQISSKNVLYYQTQHIEINNIKMAPLHIDGDPTESAAQVKMSILPQAISLLIP